MIDRLKGLEHLRHGPPWLIGERALFAPPDWDSTRDEDLVEAWDLGDGQPVFGPDDFEQMHWTTAEEHVLDNGTLVLVDPDDAGDTVRIQPTFFRGTRADEGIKETFRVGWNLNGYLAVGQTFWKLMNAEKPDICYHDKKPGECSDCTTNAGDGIPLAGFNPEAAALMIITHPVCHGRYTTSDRPIDLPQPKETHPMRTSNLEISGQLVVHYSQEDICDMMDDDDDKSPVSIKDGSLQRTQSMDVQALINRTKEELREKFGEIVEHAEIQVTNGREDGIDVDFNFSFSV